LGFCSGVTTRSLNIQALKPFPVCRELGPHLRHRNPQRPHSLVSRSVSPRAAERRLLPALNWSGKAVHGVAPAQNRTARGCDGAGKGVIVATARTTVATARTTAGLAVRFRGSVASFWALAASICASASAHIQVIRSAMRPSMIRIAPKKATSFTVLISSSDLDGTGGEARG
jgi:hypothetical protein